MFETPLCELAYKYGADKCPQIGHMYTPYYYELLKAKKYEFKKILEVGVGNNRQVAAIPGAYIGASLRMWRDFFPNAWVYGADNKPESINIKDERLSTHYCDEMNADDIKKLVEITGTDIDLVVDDACHHIESQEFLFRNLMPMLDKKVVYIVEDCRRTRYLRKTFPEYNADIPQFQPNPRPLAHDGVIIFTNK